MQQPTDPAPPRQTLDDLIGEAVSARQDLPPHERCVELNQRLRAEIGDLILAVQEAAGAAPLHSRDWHRLHNVLDDTTAVLAGSLGSGYMSAALHVGALARQAEALRDALARRH
ncbi:DUF6415 family natural product biosynthesis protein [Streptomyces sp. NPDC004082]